MRRDARCRIRAVGEQGLELGSGLGAEVSLKDFRKDITIEVYNDAGRLALASNVFRCGVLEYQSLPDLDANPNAVAIQSIKLENEGIERDYAATEPSEPSLIDPEAERWGGLAAVSLPGGLWLDGACRRDAGLRTITSAEEALLDEAWAACCPPWGRRRCSPAASSGWAPWTRWAERHQEDNGGRDPRRPLDQDL